MKKIFSLFTVLTLAGVMWSCSDDYDDSDIWNEINGIKAELATINDQLSTLRSAIDGGCVITSVEATADGHILTFSNGNTLEVKNGINGANGKDGSVIGVKLNDEGVLCWTIDGEFILNPETQEQVPVQGAQGETGRTPVLAIDSEGYWTVDGVRLTVDGQPVKAQGDSFFKGIEENEDTVTLILADGSEIPLSKAVECSLVFAEKALLCKAGSPVTVSYTATGIEFVEIFSAPEGWSAEIDEKAAQVTVTPDASATEGRLTVIGADKQGRTYMAAVELYTRLPEGGFFVWNEGWYGHDPAVLNYYCDGTWFKRVYKTVNPDSPLGNTGTNMVRNAANGLTYLVCKDNPNLVEVNDLLEKQSQISATATTGQGWDFSPYDATTGYMTASNGLFEISLNPVSVSKSIYTERGSYADVQVAEGKVFFIFGSNVNVYDPQTEEISTLCPAATGFRQTSDGRLWVANTSSVTSIDPATLEYESVATGNYSVRYNSVYTPCAIDVTPDGSAVYFFTGSRYSATDLVRYDVATGEMSKIYTVGDGFTAYGCGVCVDPQTGDIYVLTCKSYSLFRIYVIAPDGTEKEVIPYTTDTDKSYWFPSEIIFN